VELIFCSPSVESQCKDLLETYPTQLRVYRLPIFCFNPFSSIANPMKWMRCKTFVMCRYDFFPELIKYGSSKAQKFVLLAGSLKNYDQKNHIVKKYLKEAYKTFDQIVAVTEEDRDKFETYFEIDPIKLQVYDFRILQIMNRLDHKEEKIQSKLATSKILLAYIDSISGQKVLFGSYWKEEFGIFKKSIKDFLQNKTQVFIAPHQLDQHNLELIKKDFTQAGLLVFEIHSLTTEEELSKMITDSQTQQGVWLLNVKGILCELYSYFDFAYVGGGFGTSIHSVLEPFIAGAVVFCGPKVGRSTEYSLIKESNPDRLYKISKKGLVLEKIISINPDILSKTDHFKDHYKGHKDIVFKWLGLQG